MRALFALVAALSIPTVIETLASATPHDAGVTKAQRHRRLAHTVDAISNSTALAKRDFDNARFTYYYVEVGEVACGGWYHDADHVRICPSYVFGLCSLSLLDCGSEYRGEIHAPLGPVVL